MYEKNTVSPGFCFTARGNDVRLPQLTSSATHSRNSSAPWSRHTLPARRDMRRYSTSFFFGTGVTKPSTYAMARLLLHGAHRLADRPDRPHFDRADLRRRNPGSDLDRLVQVARLDHVEAGKALLRLGEGAVGHRDLAVAHAHRGRGGDRLQRLRGDAVAASADFVVKGDAVPVVHGLQRVLFPVDQTQIFHGVFSAMVFRLARPASNSVPCIAHVTSVVSPLGCRMKSTVLRVSNGSSICSVIVTRDAGAVSTISIVPLPTFLLP